MRPEDRLQSRCRMFLDSHMLPPCWWSSVGAERKQTLRQGQVQKARGFRRGLPDVMIWAPGYFLGVELKSANGRQTPEQAAFQAKMRTLQHGYELCRSVEQLGEALDRHGISMAAGWRIAAQHHDAALDTPKPLAKKPRNPRNPRIAKPKATRGAIERGNRLALALARGPR